MQVYVMDKNGKRIALGNRVRTPDGAIERVTGFRDGHVVHGAWETRPEYLERL